MSAKVHCNSEFIVESSPLQLHKPLRLPTTTDTVSQIAYALGFEYPQYFSRLFKKQTGQTPQEFRAQA